MGNVFSSYGYSFSQIFSMGSLTSRTGDDLEDGRRILVLGGFTRDSLTSVQKYVGVQKHIERYKNVALWQSCADSKVPIFKAAVATNNTHVFVVDGNKCFDKRVVGIIQVYDIKNDCWSVIKDILQTPRENATATVVNGKLYVFGGYSRKSGYLSSVEVFTIVDGCCLEPCKDHGVPDLREERSEHASVTVGNVVYILGGFNCGTFPENGKYLSSCESVDVSTGVSEQLPPLNQARAYLTADIYEQNIIAIGGHNDEIDIFGGRLSERYNYLDSVETYSFATNQWTVMRARMLMAAHQHCSVVYNNKIFVIDDTSIEVYDGKQWKYYGSFSDSLPGGRDHAKAIVIPS